MAWRGSLRNRITFNNGWDTVWFAQILYMNYLQIWTQLLFYLAWTGCCIQQSSFDMVAASQRIRKVYKESSTSAMPCHYDRHRYPPLFAEERNASLVLPGHSFRVWWSLRFSWVLWSPQQKKKAGRGRHLVDLPLFSLNTLQYNIPNGPESSPGKQLKTLDWLRCLFPWMLSDFCIVGELIAFLLADW